jgi:putative tricarboxylic transport membrane protein
VSCSAHAADWKPERSIEIIVGTGVGGGQDKSARTLQRVLQERKLVGGSPQLAITVVNKPGGGGAVGWNYLNQHAGDAHYVEIGNPTLLTNHIIGRSPMTYTDVSVIATLFTESVALSVRAESPIKSIRDLAERLRNDVTSVSFSVGSSLGSANHIAMARLARLAGADPRRMKAVVFQGGGEAITALLGGHVDLIASAANNVVPHMASGKIRVLGVTSEKRLEGSFAAVPTLREQGHNVTISNGRLLAGPRGMTPAQIVYWEGVLAKMVETAEWKKDLDQNEFEPLFLTSKPAQAYLKSQYDELKHALSDIGMAK